VVHFAPEVAQALTDRRTAALAAVATRFEKLRQLVADAHTTEVLLVPLPATRVERWRRLSEEAEEDWAYIRKTNGSVLATDEPSVSGRQHPAEAVAYPEIHTRLVAWWLIHAWRFVDLFEDTLSSLGQWRITVAPVTARALIEEVGCFRYEAKQVESAWKTAKSTTEDMDRPLAVHDELSTVLTKASLGSRLRMSPEEARAVNVMTYVKKLAKAAGQDQIIDWYDWLSDAAHPAFGARIAMGSSPARHQSGAVIVRFYARRPVVVHAGSKVGADFTIAHYSADTLAACGSLGLNLLEQALLLVDDFGLTTGAATLTARRYWRSFSPVKGSRACPCGRGKWSKCGHWWGGPSPSVSLVAGSESTDLDGRA